MLYSSWFKSVINGKKNSSKNLIKLLTHRSFKPWEILANRAWKWIKRIQKWGGGVCIGLEQLEKQQTLTTSFVHHHRVCRLDSGVSKGRSARKLDGDVNDWRGTSLAGACSLLVARKWKNNGDPILALNRFGSSDFGPWV